MVFHSAVRQWQRKVRQAELPLPLRLICSYRKPTKVPKEGERGEGGTTKRVWLLLTTGCPKKVWGTWSFLLWLLG